MGKAYPWPRVEACPRCGHCRVWGHGYVTAYFDGYEDIFWLRRYRCPACRLVLRLRPSGYFPRFQVTIEAIRQSIVHRFYRQVWPPGRSRQQGRHWFKALVRKAGLYLGISEVGNLMEAMGVLMSRGVNPVSRSV